MDLCRYDMYKFDVLYLVTNGKKDYINKKIICDEIVSKAAYLIDKKGDCLLFDQAKKIFPKANISNMFAIFDFTNFVNCKDPGVNLQLFENGFDVSINGETINFVIFLKSNSMSRQGKVCYINSLYKDELYPRVTFGFDDGSEKVLSKWYAYSGLCLSDCRALINNIKLNSDEIVVVKDFTKTIKTDCITAISIPYFLGKFFALEKSLKNLKKQKDLTIKEIIDNNLDERISNFYYEISCYKNSPDYENLFVYDEVYVKNAEDIIENKKVITKIIEFFIKTSITIEEVRQQISQFNLEFSKYNNETYAKEVTWFKMKVSNFNVEVNFFDGEGLISMELADIINDELINKNISEKRNGSFQIRLPFIKGVVHSCDFLSFFKENNITAIKGMTFDKSNPVKTYTDLNKIKMILTESQFKCASFIENSKGNLNFDKMIALINEYDYPLGITNLEPKKDNLISLNYQFLSTLPIQIEHIESILSLTQSSLIENSSLESIGEKLAVNSIEEQIYKQNPNFYGATSKFYNHQKDLLESTKNDVKLGRILSYGYRKYICGDLLGLLYHTAGLKFFNKLVKLNSMYVPNTDIKDGRCVLLRNPHYSKNEISILNNINEPSYEHQKYFGHLTGVVMINPLSCTADRLGGADYDGDTVLIINYAKIVKSIENEIVYLNPLSYKKPFIKIPSLNATKKNLNYENVIRTFINTFSNEVGLISNIAFKEAVNAYAKKDDSLEDRVAFYTILGGLEIDSAKSGRKPNISSLPVIDLESLKCGEHYLELKEAIDNINSNDYKTSQECIKTIKSMKPIVEEYKDQHLLYHTFAYADSLSIPKIEKEIVELDIQKCDNLEKVIKNIAVIYTYKETITAISNFKQKIKNQSSGNINKHICVTMVNDILNKTNSMNFFDLIKQIDSNLECENVRMFFDYVKNEKKYHFLTEKKEKEKHLKELGINKLDDNALDVLSNFKKYTPKILYLCLYYLAKKNDYVYTNKYNSYGTINNSFDKKDFCNQIKEQYIDEVLNESMDDIKTIIIDELLVPIIDEINEKIDYNTNATKAELSDIVINRLKKYVDDNDLLFIEFADVVKNIYKSNMLFDIYGEQCVKYLKEMEEMIAC